MFVNLVCWMALDLVAGFIASRLIDQRTDDPKLGIVLAGVAAAIGAVVGIGLWSVIRGFAARA